MTPAERKEYNRKWWAAHPEKAKMYADKKDPIREAARKEQWRRDNPAYAKQYMLATGYNKKYYASNSEDGRKRALQWRRANPDKALQAATEYRLANPKKRLAWQNKRRARQMQAPGDHHTALDVRIQFCIQGARCFYCACDITKGYHIDHKTPLCRGGSNGAENIVCACAPCNMHKHTKTAEEFFQVLYAGR